jgi:hypothetical protein
VSRLRYCEYTPQNLNIPLQQAYEKALTPDHTSTFNVIYSLYVLYYNLERLDEADTMFEQALQGYERGLGLDHTSILVSS